MKIRDCCIFALLIVAIFLSCEDDGTSSQELHSVSGYVFYSDLPAENITVSIDGKINHMVRTNSDGYFNLAGVRPGDHQLTIRKNLTKSHKSAANVQSFSEKTYDISVYEDLVLNFLKLPKAVQLYDADAITSSSAELAWSPTDDDNFREYKLYKHNTSGLDETTGTLAHVSTSLFDTLFVDETLNPNEAYFYRVYVMDDFGRIGGSNIVDFQTNNVQLIRNFGFEETSASVPTNWQLFAGGDTDTFIRIDTVDAFEGNNSLNFNHGAETGCWEMWISQDLDRNYLIAGAVYELTFAFKADFVGQSMFNLILRNPELDQWDSVWISIENANQWFEHTHEFALPNDIGNYDLEFSVHFCSPGAKSWWLDNLQIMRLD